MQREDDKPEAIKRRLENYDNQTKPLLNYYGSKGVLVTVNGDQHIDDVTEDILTAIKERA